MGFLDRHFLGQTEESESDDIVRNLKYIFSAKRGASTYFPDFGLSEPHHRSIEEGIARFSEEIRSSVARYEPRVHIREIEEIYDDSGRIQLQLHLEIRKSHEKLSLTATTPRL